MYTLAAYWTYRHIGPQAIKHRNKTSFIDARGTAYEKDCLWYDGMCDVRVCNVYVDVCTMYLFFLGVDGKYPRTAHEFIEYYICQCVCWSDNVTCQPSDQRSILTIVCSELKALWMVRAKWRPTEVSRTIYYSAYVRNMFQQIIFIRSSGCYFSSCRNFKHIYTLFTQSVLTIHLLPVCHAAYTCTKIIKINV